MSNESKNGKFNQPSLIFLIFKKQIELFLLIPKKNLFDFGKALVKSWTIQYYCFLWLMKHNN